MADKMPTIIFVLGGWHNEFHLQPVLPYLQDYGYDVIPITLKTSIKSDPPPVLQDNVDHILSVVRTLVHEGNSFVLVGHSVAGHSITIAANDFLATASPPQRALFKHIVFVACFLDAARIGPHLTWASVDRDSLWVEVHDAHATFYNDMSSEQAQPYVDALTANRAQWPPEISDQYKQVQGTFFQCSNDHAIPPDIQRLEAQEASMRLVELNSDHVPFVSHPRELSAELHKTIMRTA